MSELLLPERRERLFEPREVYEERVQGRLVVYLDNNIWVDLRDGNDTRSLRCREICLAAVREGKAIFPVSYASISELFETPRVDARARQADLMDNLSTDVTFRNASFIFAMEGESVFRHFFRSEKVQPRQNEVFTGLPHYLADEHIFPGGLPGVVVAKATEDMRKRRNWLRFFVDQDKVEDVQKRHASVYTYADQMIAQRTTWLEEFGGRKLDPEEIIRREREWVFKEYAFPAINTAISGMGREKESSVNRILAARGCGSPDRLRDVLRAAAPALEVFAQRLASFSLRPQGRIERQDFWDVEHACLAPVYADSFVTADRRLRERLPLGEARHQRR